LCAVTFYTGLHNRSLRAGLAIISPSAANPELPIAKSIRAAPPPSTNGTSMKLWQHKNLTQPHHKAVN
jgi:hypothetical protein